MAQDKVTTDNNDHDQLETDNDTWRSELSAELQLVVDALSDHDPDYKTVAVRLRNLHMEFYADKLENLEYQAQAKADNVGKPNPPIYDEQQQPADTGPADEAIRSGHAELATDKAAVTDSTGTIRPAQDDTGMATTDNTEPVAKK